MRGFLYNLFADKYIIDLPFGARQGVAALISSLRAKSARANYAKMGGGSPILTETRAQAEALQKKLDLSGFETRVFIGMRYWHPFIAEAVAEIEAWGAEEIVVLPLYPQFSSTTTLTGFVAFKAAYRGPAKVHYVCCYAGNDDFVAAQADLIRHRLDSLPAGNRRILFSAHGLPDKIIRQGDPYQEQVERCVARIMARLGDIDHVICYQMPGRAAEMDRAVDRRIDPPGRYRRQEHTGGADRLCLRAYRDLVELDIDYFELANQCGIEIFARVPTLRTDRGFMSALAGEVRKALASNGAVTGDNDCAACHKFCPKLRA